MREGAARTVARALALAVPSEPRKQKREPSTEGGEEGAAGEGLVREDVDDEATGEADEFRRELMDTNSAARVSRAMEARGSERNSNEKHSRREVRSHSSEGGGVGLRRWKVANWRRISA